MSSVIKKVKKQTEEYEIGLMRNQLALDMQRRVVDVINKEQHRKDPYYILVYSNLEAVKGMVETRLMVMNYMPPKIIGTILYSVDNKLGQLRRIWIIPQDVPRVEEFVDYETGMAQMNEIHKSIKDMPIVY